MAETLNRPCAVVTGASSQIGWFAVPRLARAGYTVIALSRQGRPDGYPVLDAVTWAHPTDLPEAASGASVLLSAGPLAVAERVSGTLLRVRRIVAFSSTSVWAKADSPDRGEQAQMQAIRRAEERLKITCRDRGIRLCLLRPTLVYGAGMDMNVTRLAALVRRLRWFPLAGDAGGLRQPVHADDLAAAALSLISINAEWPEELALCGGSTLTYVEMLRRIATAAGRPLRPVRLPAGLLAFTSRFLAWLPGLRGITPEMVRRQGRDLVFDDSLARELLVYRPRPFRPRPEDLQQPEAARLLALSGQFDERRARQKC